MKTVILDDWEYASQRESVQLERLQAFSDVAIYHDQPTWEELKQRLQDADGARD